MKGAVMDLNDKLMIVLLASYRSLPHFLVKSENPLGQKL